MQFRWNGGTASTKSKNSKSDGAIVGSTGVQSRSTTALLPIMGVVLVAFLVIGFALPVLPLHVHQRLGLSTFVVGLVTGSQFAASLISRVWSGRYTDGKGAKRAVVMRRPSTPDCRRSRRCNGRTLRKRGRRPWAISP